MFRIFFVLIFGSADQFQLQWREQDLRQYKWNHEISDAILKIGI